MFSYLPERLERKLCTNYHYVSRRRCYEPVVNPAIVPRETRKPYAQKREANFVFYVLNIVWILISNSLVRVRARMTQIVHSTAQHCIIVNTPC